MDSLSVIPSAIALPDSTAAAGQGDWTSALSQSTDSLTTALCQAIGAEGNLGMAGEPLPYTIKTDSLMTLAVLGCLLFTVIAVARSMPFFTRQVKNFFWHGGAEADIGETSTEVRLQVGIALMGCMLLGMASYLFATDRLGATFRLSSHVPVIALYTALALAYFTLKTLIYTAVNLTLFTPRQNLQLLKSLLFVTALQSMLLLPVVLLQVYMGLAQQTATVFCFLIFILSKILTFYKAWSIFFRKNGAFLQTFLYFCTLEIVPLLAVCGVLVLLTDAIKVN